MKYVIAISLIFHLFLSACVIQNDTVTPNSYERKVELTGQNNFRDLGAYSTENGNSIKKGVLFRSGTLSKLTEEDKTKIEDLGLSKNDLFNIRRNLIDK